MNLSLLSTHDQTCSICTELVSGAESRLARLFQCDGIISAVAERTKNFAVIPSIGALVPGHSLVVPLSHEPNVLLYAAATDLAKELIGTLDRHLQSLSQTFGKSFLMFEHGSTCLGHSLCSTEHGHLHILPLSEQTIDSVFECLREIAEVIPFSDLTQKSTESEDFIFVSSLNERWSTPTGFFLRAKHLPSQYMRRIVAKAVGNESWNWKVEPAKELVRMTIAKGFDLKKASNQPEHVANSLDVYAG